MTLSELKTILSRHETFRNAFPHLILWMLPCKGSKKYSLFNSCTKIQKLTLLPNQGYNFATWAKTGHRFRIVIRKSSYWGLTIAYTSTFPEKTRTFYPLILQTYILIPHEQPQSASEFTILLLNRGRKAILQNHPVNRRFFPAIPSPFASPDVEVKPS